ncbi:MAG: hypothetical protein IJI83_00735, partial [Oscillospiraceae bacterium]|nr:hypothetical protein [Oscillospiraceae bacterium]
WTRIYDLYGIDGLKHKPANKDWTPEERYDLVARVLAGSSVTSAAIEACFLEKMTLPSLFQCNINA